MASLSTRTLVEQNLFQQIHRLTKDELNQQDRKGRTMLHWAVILKNWEMVITLVDKGCRLDICDNQFDTPLHYSIRNSEIERLLLEEGSPIRGCKAIHLAAREGDLKAIKSILAKDKNAIHKIDSRLNLPICYAAQNQREHIVKYLIEKGSFVDWVNTSQLSLVELAQINDKDTPLSEYLKKQIALPPMEMTALVNSFKKILEKEYAISKKLKKTFVVVLGELHGIYSIFEVEKAFLKVAKEMGINQCYMELPSGDKNWEKIDIELEAEKLNMTVARIDDHYYRGTASVDQRNLVMTRKVKEKDCVMIVGAAHIKGIVNKKSVRLPPEQFHVVPFNLGPIASRGGYGVVISLVKQRSVARFMDNESNVILVSRSGITEPEQVLKKYNNDKRNLKSKNAFINFIAIIIMAYIICYPLYLLYLAVGLLLTIAITIGTIISRFFIHCSIEKEKTLGLKEYKELGKGTLIDVQQDKLNAFMDGTKNSPFSKFTSCFRYRDWRYMRDYYAGCAAKEVDKEKLISRVKARVG